MDMGQRFTVVGPIQSAIFSQWNTDALGQGLGEVLDKHNLRTRANLSTKVERLVPEGGLYLCTRFVGTAVQVN